MALTAAEKTQVFEILGLPESGPGVSYSDLMGAYGPAMDGADLLSVATLVTAILGAVSATVETRVRTLLERHAAITSSSPLQVRGAANGVRGVLVDHPAEREAIRVAIGNLIGVAVPQGGFVLEATRKARGVGMVGR